MPGRSTRSLPLLATRNIVVAAGVLLMLMGIMWWGFVAGTDALVPLPTPAAPIVLDASSPTGAAYVGGANCRECHQEQYGLWQQSHHDLAMKPADESSVLGDFDNATFEHHGVASTFYRKDGGFFVRTAGADGELRDYQVLYTFGWTPLQQYLVAFPGGKLQTLPLCWDSQPADAGGQRWFHIYGDEAIRPDDPLYWTGPNQNWNFMCAECHSTNLRKAFDAEAATYRTSWSEVNVSCEACHGPGSEHLKWAQGKPLDARYPIEDDKGLTVRLRDLTMGSWQYDAASGYYQRSEPLASSVLTDTCARCHALRGTLAEDYVHGRSIHDTHQVELLGDAMYHTDGQIREEVYVYGSFVQSRMYQAGVRCVDCHDPHSLKLRRTGNALCTHCHTPERYDTVEHHFHPKAGEGTRCTDCHMIQRTYMQVDPRRDHSLRNPRPDLTVQIATPNACNDCHSDQTAQWSVEHVTEWYGPTPRHGNKPHYGQVIHAARHGMPNAAELLTQLIGDDERPAIHRATALSAAGNVLTPELLQLAVVQLRDADPLVRRAAVGNLRVLPPAQRWQLAAVLLEDPIRSVRLEAALVLAAGRRDLTDKTQMALFDKVAAEYHAAQRLVYDRASGHFAAGLMHSELGHMGEALAAYQRAIAMEPWFVPAIINSALFQRRAGRNEQAHQTLLAGAKRLPDAATVRYELGMSHVRQGDLPTALAELKAAAELEPDAPQYAYGYGVALNSSGQPDHALEVLSASAKRHPHDRATLFALTTLHRDRGNLDKALEYAGQLVEAWPGDRQARQLQATLAAQRRTP
jgi:tetratricopeptide (TPR) repeat protein